MHRGSLYKTPEYECGLLYNSDYPQSRNGSGGYPPSGGGIKEGGRVPKDAPVLSLNISPAMIRKSTNQIEELGRNIKGKSIKVIKQYILVLKKEWFAWERGCSKSLTMHIMLQYISSKGIP